METESIILFVSLGISDCDEMDAVITGIPVLSIIPIVAHREKILDSIDLAISQMAVTAVDRLRFKTLE